MRSLMSDLMQWNLYLRFAVAVLATWRVTHLLSNEDGPVDIILRLRALLGQSLLGGLMDCFNCLSLWIAAPAALFVSRRPTRWFFCTLAVSGAACLLQRLGHEPIVMECTSESMDGDKDNVLR